MARTEAIPCHGDSLPFEDCFSPLEECVALQCCQFPGCVILAVNKKDEAKTSSFWFNRNVLPSKHLLGCDNRPAPKSRTYHAA